MVIFYIAKIHYTAMRAIILAAGEGYRLRPLTAYMPKVMLPVGNRPILEYVITALRKNSVKDITIVVGYKSDKIKQYFGSGKDFNVNIEYVTQRKLLGTAHALYKARTDEEFLLLYGDNIVSERCVEELLKEEKNTIIATYSKRASRYGIVKVKNGKLEDFTSGNSQDEGLIFTGMGRFSPDIFEEIEKIMEMGVYELTDVLKEMKVKVKISHCGWSDAIYPMDLLMLNEQSLRNNVRRISGKIEESTIIGNVEIGENTKIGAGAYIRGNVKIGENCDIGPNSVIIGDTSIGDGVIIGALSYVENSIIMKDTQIEEGSLIKNSVIGRDVSIGPKFVTISGKRERITDGEIVDCNGGAIIGDGAELGAMVIVHPGIRIGANSKISDLKVLTEDVLNGESVR